VRARSAPSLKAGGVCQPSTIDGINNAKWSLALPVIRESATLFIPSNAYVYCITMKLLLRAPCTTIMLDAAPALIMTKVMEALNVDGEHARPRTDRNTQMWQRCI
jgi:hypothetical protein